MNRNSSFFHPLAIIFLAGGLAYAQHGHGPGGMGGGGMSGMHGASNSHSEAPTAGEDPHASSSLMASKNPGGVLDQNKRLSAKLENLLGLSGPNALQNLKNDASGFKNFGQFVAAVHVSRNLDIPFADLQAKMSGDKAMSLGKAIQELKPDADSKGEAKKATAEAAEDVKEPAS
jgi:hypothetical protein